jgi:hypothetical protein
MRELAATLRAVAACVAAERLQRGARSARIYRERSQSERWIAALEDGPRALYDRNRASAA